MKKLIAPALAGLLFATSALAQVNFVPQIGVNTTNLRQPTYSAVSINLAPATTSATDIFCIAASATKSIAVRRIEISGTIATAAVTFPVSLLRRAALDTGGTAATSTALPVAGANNNNNPASGATLIAYTANPTINDSSPTYLRSNALTLALVTTTSASDTLVWYGGTHNDAYDQGFDLIKGSTQQLCISFNGATITNAAALQINIEWVEN